MKINKITSAMAIIFSAICYTGGAFSVQSYEVKTPDMVISNLPVEVTPSSDLNILPSHQFNYTMPEQEMFSNRNNIEVIDPGDIINLGKLIWDIVKNGKPVVDTKTDFATGVPAALKNWEDMYGWSAPVAKPFSFNWSILGLDAVTFDYSIFYTYGGNFNGAGQYLTNVMVVPTNVYVIWGYDFSASVNVGQVVNVGTKKNPKSAMQLELKLLLNSLVDHYETTVTFYITGDGQFKQLSAPVSHSMIQVN